MTINSGSRTVRAVHAVKAIGPDPVFELGLTEHLRHRHDAQGLCDLYGRFAHGEAEFDALMRRVIVRALVRRMGNGVSVGRGVLFRHSETFEIDDGVFIGDHAVIQGRVDGTCIIGAQTWIGPQAYLDARDLVIEESVGWGPGAKVLGSTHTGLPVDVPVIQTDLEIKRVRIGAWADIGVNAVILPGVTIGRGAIVGAGAVVVDDIPAFAVAAGVPARVLRYREGAPRE
jgi:acetyltransferase-like isoleucine patch superfamily enzyme